MLFEYATIVLTYEHSDLFLLTVFSLLCLNVTNGNVLNARSLLLNKNAGLYEVPNPIHAAHRPLPLFLLWTWAWFLRACWLTLDNPAPLGRNWFMIPRTHMSISTKRMFLFKASMSFISSSVKEKSKIWNNRNKKTDIWNSRRWVKLGIRERGQQWEPFKDYGHLCKCPKGTRQMLGGHPTYGELEFFLPLVFKTILLGTSCNKFQVFWNNMHSEHFLKF